jgi:hypothetical protein
MRLLLNMKHSDSDCIRQRLYTSEFEQDAAIGFWFRCDRGDDFKGRHGIEAIWITDIEGGPILGLEDWWKHVGRLATAPKG